MKRILFLSFSLLIFLSSCVKRKDVPVGEAHVRFVNAVDSFPDQDVYAGGKLLPGGTIGFGGYTPYYTQTSGFTIFEFTFTGTQEVVGQIDHGMDIGSYSTIYFYRDLKWIPRTGAIRDDMSVPPAGKARVRFIHLNYYLDNWISVAAVGGAELVPQLAFNWFSPYFNVDPGTKFQTAGTGILTAPVIDANLVAGKIYTIWIYGESGTDLRPRIIMQN